MRKITNLDEIINDYDAILSDIWGVVHNGIEPFKNSVSALSAARAKGVKVVLITNAPSSSKQVIRHLKHKIGAGDEFYDDIITSGDVAKSIIDGWSDKKCFHLGVRDSDTEAVQPSIAELVDIEQADYVLCTFLARTDEVDPQDYLPLLKQMKQKELPFLCSNPDAIVDVGGVLYYCAGTLAKMYEELNGEVIYTGKPHAAIYEEALKKLANLGADIKPSKILIIGDGLATDVPGANRLGSDMLLVADGIHAREFEQANADENANIYSPEFIKFIEKQIEQRGVKVDYFIEQLA